VIVAPKPTQNVGFLESRATTITSKKTNDQEGLICSDYAVSSYANADGLSQLYISNLDSMSRSTQNLQSAAAKHTIDSHKLQKPVELPKECGPRQNCNVDELAHSSNSSMMGEVTNRVLPRNSSCSISGESSSSPVLEANTKGTVESELAHSLAAVLESTSSRFVEQSSSAARTSTNTAPESRAEIKGTPILHTSMSTDHLPVILTTTEQLRLKTEAKQGNQDSTFMPFERSTLCKTLSTLGVDLGIKRETSFLAAHGPNQRHTVETMSEAEKAQKITEIQARPSRKQYFGSDHRLAHKRWHGLDDIHDERIGAWKPQVALKQNHPDANEDVDMNGETVRTLREVFNLPNNMIPMNDGQTELAFRDGTLVMAQDFAQ
jgi:hypothetical protein